MLSEEHKGMAQSGLKTTMKSRGDTNLTLKASVKAQLGMKKQTLNENFRVNRVFREDPRFFKI